MPTIAGSDDAIDSDEPGSKVYHISGGRRFCVNCGEVKGHV